MGIFVRMTGKIVVMTIVTMLLVGLFPPVAEVGAETGSRNINDIVESSTGLPGNTEYVAVAVGHFNGDNFLDIGSGILSWLGGNNGLDAWTNTNGAQSWSKQSTGLPTTGGFGELEAADIDNDGDDDLVVPYESGWSGEAALGVRVYVTNGAANPTWSDGTHPTTGGSFYAVAIDDVDGDGNLDVGATGTAGARVWLGNGGTSWTAASTGLPTTGNYYGIEFGDINNDTTIDMVIAGDNGVHAYIGNGGTSWSQESSGLPSTGQYNGVNLTDFNNDDNLDIAVGSWQLGMKVYTGDGGAGGAMSWTQESSNLPTNGFYSQIACGDVDLDGNADLLGGEAYGGGIKFYLGDGGSGGTMTWTQHSTDLPVNGAYSGAMMADLDNDGDLDIIVSDSGVNQGGAVGIRVFLPDVISIQWPPVADAGPDQTVLAGDTVQLDGTGSSDRNGNVAGYKWNVSEQPSGANIVLSDDTVVSPSFVASKIGKYVLTLSVRDNDGRWGLLEGMVNITADPWPNSPPEVKAGPDQTVTIFDLVQLDGTASTDDSQIAEYDWNLTLKPQGSNSTLSDETLADPTFTPDRIGTYTFTLSVKDDNDTWSGKEDDIKVTVNPSGTGSPVANAGMDVTIELDGSFFLNGTASQDDQEVKEYLWTIETEPPGSSLQVQNVGVQELTPAYEGVYQFSLLVMDNDFLWSIEADFVQVTVLPRNLPPLAMIDDPSDEAEFYTTDTIEFDGSNSFDPEGLDVTLLWTSDIDGVLSDEASFSTNLTHGVHQITLEITDDHDQTASAMIEVTVKLDTIPTTILTASTTLILNGEKVSFDGTKSSDAEGTVSKFFFDYGDGSDSGWLSQPTMSHQYKKTGDFTATLKVQDYRGQQSETSEGITITVGEKPVAALKADVPEIRPGKSVTFDASGSTDADGEIVEYYFDFGDGTNSDWVTTPSVTRTYETAGQYTITVKVKDDHGFESSNYVKVRITVQKAQKPTTDGDGLSAMLFPIILVIIIAVVVVVVVLVMKKRSSGPKDDGPTQPETGQQLPPPPPGYDQGQYQYDQSGQQQGYDQGYGYDQQQTYDQGYGYDQQQTYDQGQYQQDQGYNGYDQSGYQQGNDQSGYDQDQY